MLAFPSQLGLRPPLLGRRAPRRERLTRWPGAAFLAKVICPLIEGQYKRGIAVRLVRESQIADEPELLTDFGRYGHRATGQFDLDQSCRTVRFTLDFTPKPSASLKNAGDAYSSSPCHSGMYWTARPAGGGRDATTRDSEGAGKMNRGERTLRSPSLRAVGQAS